MTIVRAELPTSGGVYQILNVRNAKSYVGSSVNVRRRLDAHLSQLRCLRHDNGHLQAAWAKYGADAFRLIVLERVDDATMLLSREAHHVASLGPEYNLSTVHRGKLGHRQSTETREKIRLSHLGSHHSPETCARLSELAKARGIPQLMRDRQRAAVTGRPRSAETCAAISAGKIGRSASATHRASVSEGVRRWNARRAADGTLGTKLVASDVYAIRAARTGGVPVRLLAIRFGVTCTQIRRIERRESWKLLPEES